MSKRIEIDGKFFRERRGKLVEIPSAWVGKVTTEQTMRKRASKKTNKHRRHDEARSITKSGCVNLDRLDGRFDMIDEDA